MAHKHRLAEPGRGLCAWLGLRGSSRSSRFRLGCWRGRCLRLVFKKPGLVVYVANFRFKQKKVHIPGFELGPPGWRSDSRVGLATSPPQRQFCIMRIQLSCRFIYLKPQRKYPPNFFFLYRLCQSCFGGNTMQQHSGCDALCGRLTVRYATSFHRSCTS